MSEITFLVEEPFEGGYIAKAVGESIITQADTREELKEQITDAIMCHFDNDDRPKFVHLHFVKDEIFALK